MEHTPFEYGGLHFIPERQFEPAGKHHSLIHVSRLRLDVELGFAKKGMPIPANSTIPMRASMQRLPIRNATFSAV